MNIHKTHTHCRGYLIGEGELCHVEMSPTELANPLTVQILCSNEYCFEGQVFNSVSKVCNDEGIAEY